MGKALTGLVCALVLHINMAHALRCGREVGSTKDFKIEVRRKCGDPVSLETWTAYEIIPRYDGPHNHHDIFGDWFLDNFHFNSD